MNSTELTLKQYISANHSEYAVCGYLRIIKQYLNYKTEEIAQQSTYFEVVDYMGVLRKRGMHPKTMKNHLYCIKIYYQWLVEIDKRRDHPCRDFHLKDKVNRAISIETLYSKEELEEIVQSHVSKLPLAITRDKIVLSLLVNQAITVFEIIHLKIKDVNLIKGTISVAGSVKTKPRELPLKAEQIMLLNDYLSFTRKHLLRNNTTPTKQDEEALILSARGNKMKPISISAMFKHTLSNGQKITPQKIRQSAIAQLLKAGKDLRIVQAFTGHKRISSVEEYRQTGLEELKITLQKYHPFG